MKPYIILVGVTLIAVAIFLSAIAFKSQVPLSFARQSQANATSAPPSRAAPHGSHPESLPPSIALFKSSTVSPGTAKLANDNGVLSYIISTDETSLTRRTLITNSQTQIMIEDALGPLAAILPEMDIAFPTDESDSVLTKLLAAAIISDDKPRTKVGEIDAIEPNQLTFRHGPLTAPIAISPDTAITLDRYPVPFEKLRKGMDITLTHINGTATKIAATTFLMDNISHTIEAEFISADDSQLTIHRFGPDGFDVTLRPAPTLRATRDDQPVALGAFEKNDRVKVTYMRGLASDLSFDSTAPPLYPHP